MNKCPVCRAKFKGQAVCRRCRSDLSALIILEKQAETMIVHACKYLRQGDIEQARRFCTHSANLSRTEFSRVFSEFLANFSVAASTCQSNG